MKILVINWQCIKNPFGGGAEVHLHEIFKRVVERGHKVTLLACGHPDLPDEEIFEGIRIIRRGKRDTFNFTAFFEYRKRFAREDFDVVVDDINKIPFFTPLFVRKPLIAVSHHFFGKSIFRETSLPIGLYVLLGEKLVDYVYRRTPFVVVSESTLSEFVERGFKRENFSIVPNAINQAAFPMSVCEKNAYPTITYFGRLKKYKSPDHLFRAFALVRDEFPDAKLHIMGRGDFRPALEKLSSELGIVESVKFFGFVTEEEKADLLSKSHCVVNTSMKEGWGITNIEANACGTPVVSADVPGLRDSVKNGVSGLLYPYGDIEALANTLKRILRDKDLFDELEHGSIEWAKSFSWDFSADLMITALENAVLRFDAK